MKHIAVPAIALLMLAACSKTDDAAPVAPAAATRPAPPTQPAPPAPDIAPAPAVAGDAALEDAIRAAFPDYRAAAVDESGLPRGRYASARRDLDGDGSDEAIVYLMGPFFCGTGGCNLLVLTKGEAGYKEIANASIARPPVSIVKNGMNGHADIWYEQSGGGRETEYVQLAFQDGRYGALSRAPANEVPASEVIIPGDTDYAQGIELEPAP